MALAQTIHTLEAQRARLRREIADVERRLAAVAKAVGTSVRSSPVRAAPARAIGKTARSGRAKRSGRRAWFVRGEVAQLLRRVARTPKSPAEVVREIGALKGYEQGLSQQDRLRFQTAAFMAVNHAIKTGTLRRRRDGMVSVA